MKQENPVVPGIFKMYDTAKAAQQSMLGGCAKSQKKVIDELLDIQPQLNKQSWLPTYQLVEYSIPCVADYPTINKKFKVQVTFYDTATQKTATKTIFFGSDKDYIFTKNRAEKLKKLGFMRQINNPLSSDYWRAHICFGSEDWVQNVVELIRHTLKENSKKLGCLKPKKVFASTLKKEQVHPK